MKQKSYTSAILKLATLASIALSSGWFGYDYYSRYEAAYESQSTAEASLAEAESSLSSLRQVLKPDAKVIKAADKLDALMARAWESANNRDVQVKMSLMNAPGKAGQTNGGLTSYLDQVPGTRLKTGQLEITGKYETYGDLKGMMEDLERAGGFLSQINVRGTAFKLVYRVYGS